jgi:hypothetical protein
MKIILEKLVWFNGYIELEPKLQNNFKNSSDIVHFPEPQQYSIELLDANLVVTLPKFTYYILLLAVSRWIFYLMEPRPEKLKDRVLHWEESVSKQYSKKFTNIPRIA